MTTIHARPRTPGGSRGERTPGALLAGLPATVLLLAAACDFPTAMPKWDTQWMLPGKTTALSVAEVLPASVTMTPDRSAFLVTLQPVTIGRSLGELCGVPCTAATGLMVPKPAFTASIADSLRLPSDVSAATLAGGSVAVAINNGLGFDPLRPSASARGSLAITLTSGSTTVGSLTLSGDSVALPANGTLTRPVTLGAGAVGRIITVTLTLTSPAGDAVRVDPSQRFSATVTPQAVRLSDATVAVSQKLVSLEPVSIDYTDIDQSVIDRVKEPSSLVITTTNPFPVVGTMTLRFTNAAMPITKPLPLQASTATQRVPFTAQELRAILGRMVTLNASGTVNGTAPMKVTPSQSVQVATQLEVTLGPKEQ